MVSSNETGFTLKLAGNGISVEREVDTATAWRILHVVMEADGAPAAAQRPPGDVISPAPERPDPPPPAAGASGLRADKSLREYLDERQPKRNVETIVAIAAFLEEHRGLSTFKQDNVKKAFREASEALPGNFPRDFNWARKTGWIANADGKRGEYYVTNSGKEAVAANFPSSLRKTTTVSKGTRKRRTKPKAEGSDA